MTERSDLKRCGGCNRFVQPEESACPFCEHRFDCSSREACLERKRSNWVDLAAALGKYAGMTAVTACGITASCAAYGVPAPDVAYEDTSSTDTSTCCRDVGPEKHDAEPTPDAGETDTESDDASNTSTSDTSTSDSATDGSEDAE